MTAAITINCSDQRVKDAIETLILNVLDDALAGDLSTTENVSMTTVGIIKVGVDEDQLNLMRRHALVMSDERIRRTLFAS